MKHTINFKPVAKKWFTGTKPEIHQVVTRAVFTISDICSGYSNQPNKVVLGFVFRKQRKKQEGTSKGTHGKITQKGGWEVSVYSFGFDLLRALNLKVVQHPRHFTLVKSRK